MAPSLFERDPGKEIAWIICTSGYLLGVPPQVIPDVVSGMSGESPPLDPGHLSHVTLTSSLN
jgi:hypothetical protein